MKINKIEDVPKDIIAHINSEYGVLIEDIDLDEIEHTFTELGYKENKKVDQFYIYSETTAEIKGYLWSRKGKQYLKDDGICDLEWTGSLEIKKKK